MDISRFLTTYANVPAVLRGQIIVVIDGNPLTWNAAYLEVKNGSELGARILEKLTKMELI